MQVFLSWSGATSKAAATALYNWLPSVIQTIKPYMSAESIEKGERWSLDIAKQLEETNYGVICVTPENLNAPWILFEAGALSKSIERSRVSPISFGVGVADFSGSPLLQFQMSMFKKEEIKKLLHSMNSAAPEPERLSHQILEKSFDRAWPELEAEINAIDFDKSPDKATKRGPENAEINRVTEMIEEVLSLVRSQSKVLRSPDEILPRGYMLELLRDERSSLGMRSIPRNHPAWNAATASLDQIHHILQSNPPDVSLSEPERKVIEDSLREAQSALRYLKRRLYPEVHSFERMETAASN